VPELVLAGGVIEHDEILSGKLREMLQREPGGIMPQKPRRSALEGACIIARQG
jgi:hypothetical protein